MNPPTRSEPGGGSRWAALVTAAAVIAVYFPPRLLTGRWTLQGLDYWRWVAATACLALCGHPQIPFYTLAVTVAYLLYRRNWRENFRPLSAMAAGLMISGFAWAPMTALIRRSTRVLPLEIAGNDVAFPLGRLWGFLRPWKDGWPETAAHFPRVPFTGYPNEAYFWDTIIYAGLLSVLALVLVTAFHVVSRRRLHPLWTFFLPAGAAALVAAFPFCQKLLTFIPGTYLRSPARQIFVTTFSMAFAVGCLVDAFMKMGGARPWIKKAAVGALALGHFLDLGRFDRAFVQLLPREETRLPVMERILSAESGGFRVGVDPYLRVSLNRRFDDVGFFDSLILARPYETLLALTRTDPSANHQVLRGSFLAKDVLSLLGTKFVVTQYLRPDLLERAAELNLRLYEVPDPAPYACLYPEAVVHGWTREGLLNAFRIRTPSWREGVRLADDKGGVPSGDVSSVFPPTPVGVRRLSPDRLEAVVDVREGGVLRLLESWDPGWRVFVDGKPARPLRAENFFIAVRVPPGRHEVRWVYRTPGAIAGGAVSLLGALLLLFG